MIVRRVFLKNVSKSYFNASCKVKLKFLRSKRLKNKISDTEYRKKADVWSTILDQGIEIDWSLRPRSCLKLRTEKIRLISDSKIELRNTNTRQVSVNLCSHKVAAKIEEATRIIATPPKKIIYNVDWDGSSSDAVLFTIMESCRCRFHSLNE